MFTIKLIYVVFIISSISISKMKPSTNSKSQTSLNKFFSKVSHSYHIREDMNKMETHAKQHAVLKNKRQQERIQTQNALLIAELAKKQRRESAELQAKQRKEQISLAYQLNGGAIKNSISTTLTKIHQFSTI